MNAYRIVALMYHRIGETHNRWERKYCVSPERFHAHTRLLAQREMRPCAAEEFVSWVRGEGELPLGSFLLTFDDGFLSVYEHALPLLAELGWPATVFLVSGRMGQSNTWTRNESPSGATHPLLASSHIAEMRRQGFEFHSHSRTHPDLTTLGDAELEAEVRGSRDDLEDILGTAVRYMAFPYGRYDARVLQAVRAAGYEASFSVQPGFNRRGMNPYLIRRLDVFGTDTPAQLGRKVFFGTNNGSWLQTLRYYLLRFAARLRQGT